MSQFTTATFDEAINRYFEPIACEHRWPLARRGDDVYEISSPHCVMTVNWHQGWHSRNINILMRPASESANGPNQTGIWPIAGYNGEEFQYIPWENTAEGFFQEAEYMSALARKFCLPYLLGEKADWEKVKEYWRIESEKDLEKIKGYKFPPFVQKRWHLPPPDVSGKKQ